MCKAPWRDAEDNLLDQGDVKLGLAQRMELLVLISIFAPWMPSSLSVRSRHSKGATRAAGSPRYRS